MAVDITGIKKSWLSWSHSSAQALLQLIALGQGAMGQYSVFGLSGQFVDVTPADPSATPPVIAAPGDFGFYPDANSAIDSTDVGNYATLITTALAIFDPTTTQGAANLALIQKFAANPTSN